MAATASPDQVPFPVLIGDIGGTNARFALVPDRDAPLQVFRSVATADFPTIEDAIEASVLAHSSLRPRSAIIDIAGPITGDAVRLTNAHWVIRPRDVMAKLGIEDVILLNDFEALALALTALGADDLVSIGGIADAAGRQGGDRPGYRPRRRRAGRGWRALGAGAGRRRACRASARTRRTSFRSGTTSSRSSAASPPRPSSAGAASSGSTGPLQRLKASRRPLRHRPRSPGTRSTAPTRSLSAPSRSGRASSAVSPATWRSSSWRAAASISAEGFRRALLPFLRD